MCLIEKKIVCPFDMEFVEGSEVKLLNYLDILPTVRGFP